MGWQLSKLREYVEQDEDRRHLVDTITSISRATDIFRFHLFAAHDAFADLLNVDEPDARQVIEYILGVSERQPEYRYAKLGSEAHLIACINIMRSRWDIFAQVVNGAALAEPLGVGECDISKVRDALPDGDLKSTIDGVLRGRWYRYFSDFINTAKHRQLVQHSLTLSLEEERADIRISTFEYGGRVYPSYWGHEVLEHVNDVAKEVVPCGMVLNRYLGLSDDA